MTKTTKVILVIIKIVLIIIRHKTVEMMFDFIDNI